MNFDTLTLAAVAVELQDTLLGGRVERISQPEPLEIVIGVYAKNRKQRLLVSLEPTVSRIHLTQGGRPNPQTAPAFCMLLRKYLEGGWLEAVEQPFGQGERVLRLTFLGFERERYQLYVEVMGKYSNLVLTTLDERILGAIKIITTEQSRFREVRVGQKYHSPPRLRGGKRDAFAGDAGNGLPEQSFASPDEARDWLLATFYGLSPLMASEAVARAHPPSLTAETVWYGLNDILNAARLNEYAPVQYADADGRAAYPLELKSVPVERQQHWASISDALDQVYDQREVGDAFARERASLIGALNRALKTVDRELIDADEGLANSDRADEYRQSGDLLLARIRDVVHGASEVALEDYFAPNGPVTRVIALDPRLSARENAERYYRKHQKARDAVDRLTERRDDLLAAQSSLNDALADAQAAPDTAALVALAESLGEEVTRRLRHSSGQQGPKDADGKPEPDPFAGYKIKRYYSVDGWEILVGENATSNDFLTTKIATPNDIWMHARAITSAHAIIRAQNRPASVSTAALRLAAEQVARRSDAKHARLVPVDYTLRKFVRKPRRAAPGAVTYSNEKTLDVTPGE